MTGRKELLLLVLLALVWPGPSRGAVTFLGDQKQTSLVFSMPADQSASEDLPLDEPPLARTVSGFDPEGIHLTQWADGGILVSWQTGEPLLAGNADPPQPYDPATVRSAVRWGTESGNLTEQTQQDHRLVYTYVYGPEAGNTTYQSPILHHVLLRDLEPDTEYFYSVGDEANGWSEELSFRTLGDARAYPLRIGVIGDLGETANSTQTLEGLEATEPDIVLLVGDFTYANDHQSNDTSDKGHKSGSNVTESTSMQLRWDGWARMMQPLLSRVPLMATGGNHEIEQLLLANNATFTAVNARYPVPQEPGSDTLMTGPNLGIYYLNQTEWFTGNHSQFLNESDFQPQSGYFSLDLPGVHIVSLHSYLPWGVESQQYKWLVTDLEAGKTNRPAVEIMRGSRGCMHAALRSSRAPCEQGGRARALLSPCGQPLSAQPSCAPSCFHCTAVDRQRTPWLVVYMHASMYHSYVSQYMQANTFRTVYEPLFYKHQVDLVFAGHTHAYERTYPMFNYTREECGTAYITIGDGGNVEGLSSQFIDTPPQPDFCANTSLYDVAPFQPIDRPEPVITLQDGLFCPTSQPAWSAFREQSFGYGLLEVVNDTYAVWTWERNQGLGPGEVDRVEIVKKADGECSSAPAPAPSPTASSTSGVASGGQGLLGPLLLLGLLVLPAAWLF
ncbi:hypothetical protein ABPG75_008574 [Micractinium tetrahymenae]